MADQTRSVAIDTEINTQHQDRWPVSGADRRATVEVRGTSWHPRRFVRRINPRTRCRLQWDYDDNQFVKNFLAWMDDNED